MSYFILNKDLQVCGVLSLEGKGCPFYSDLRNVQLSDDDNGKLWNDTLTITVPYGYPQTDMMTEGYHLLHKGSDGRLYCFRIDSWEDIPSGETHVKVVNCQNLAIWDLSHSMVPVQTLTAVTANKAFSVALTNSGWSVNMDNTSSGTNDEEIELGSNALTVIQKLNTDFNVEIRAYVEVRNGQVIGKYIDIANQLGENTGRRIEYGKNLTSVTRTGADDSLFTKLHVYGGTPTGQDNPVSIAPVNGGNDFLVDDNANDLYNGGRKYLEGWVQNEKIWNTSGLLVWAKQQLAYYNHPKYNYTVETAQLDWNPNLGDTVDIVDFSMTPEMTVQARAIQKQESEADPTQNQITFGEFVTIKNVKPEEIERLSAEAAEANRAAQKAQAPVFKIFTPDGTDFASKMETKRLIARAYQGRQEVTYQLAPSQFNWQKINPNGSHDVQWETNHKDAGNVIVVDYQTAISTVRCAFKNDTSTIARPAYFETGSTGIRSVANKLAALQNDHTLSILFVTDSHYATGGHSNATLTIRSVDHLRNVAALTHQAKIDLVVHGGDMTDGGSPKEQIIDDQVEAAGSLANNCEAPVFFVNGNHDDASWYARDYAGNNFDEVLTPDERYSILKNFIGPDFQLNEGYENRLYGFMDFPTQKIRVICLNTFENPYIRNSDGTNKYISHHISAVMQDQLSWLANVALQVPTDDWAIAVFSHYRYAVDLDTSYKCINCNLVQDVINAFKDGKSYSGSGTTTDYEASVSVDFTGHPHDVIADFHGHGHIDQLWTDNGIPLIQTLDCLARNDYPDKMPDRPYPALAEDAWDVITIDRNKRKIYMTRFGANVDREFSY